MSNIYLNNAIGYECVECAGRYEIDSLIYICPNCFGNLDVIYDYDRIRQLFTKTELNACRDFSMWRYRVLLPLGQDADVPPLTVGWTPLQDTPSIAEEYSVKQVLLKDEGRNPTASLKDRPSALAVARALEIGFDTLTVASTGNAGIALASMCASMKLKSVIFVPDSIPKSKLAQLQIYGARIVLVEGTYDDAFNICLQASNLFGWYQRSTGINPLMTEGKKTTAFEICEQLDWQVPDKVFVAMGDGCIIGGLWKGFCDMQRLNFIDRLPQLIGVQAEQAAWIVDSLNGVQTTDTHAQRTIADSICVGYPRDATKAIRAIHDSSGFGLKVNDSEILDAVGKLAFDTGVFVEPAAAATFAGFVKCCNDGQIKSSDKVVLVLTGHGMKVVMDIPPTRSEPLHIKSNIADLNSVLSAL